MGQTAVAVAAMLVALAFAMSTFERWLTSHKRHELAWTAALGLFTLAAGALAAGAALGWNGVAFRLFYLFGAIADVPFLAVGTIYLLGGERHGDRSAVVAAAGTAFAAGVVGAAPFTHPLPAHVLVQGSRVFGPLPRVLAAVASGGGATVVFAGAVWSALRVRKRQAVLANGLISLGTLVLGASGLLNSVAGAMTAFAIALLAGVTLLFVGFLVATAGTVA